MRDLTSNGKRGSDYYTSLVVNGSPSVDHDSCSHILKKHKHSVSTTQNKLKCSQSTSSSSVVSRISSYPYTESRLRREVHAPERDSRNSFNVKKTRTRSGYMTNLVGKFGSFLRILDRCAKGKKRASKTPRLYAKQDEVFTGKKKEHEVAEIYYSKEEKRDDVADASSLGEVNIVKLNRRRKAANHLRKLTIPVVASESRSFHSSIIYHESNVNGKVDDELYETGAPQCWMLSQFIKKRYGKFLGFQKKGERIKDWHEECFMALTEEEECEIARAFKKSNRRKVLVSHENSSIYITGEDLRCLRPRGYLNDQVINLYLELLKEREKREPQKFLKCHYFNTFFYKRITGKDGYSYESVQRWTTQIKLGYSLMECDKIFVPIHQEFHWCLAVINKKEKKFQYLDSLKGVDTYVLNTLARYYVDEVKDKNGKDIDVSLWDREFVRDLPEQKNGYDCGIFMIKYVDFYSRDVGLCFSQEHIPYFRKRTAKELLQLRAE